jgi:hypothetical protein
MQREQIRERIGRTYAGMGSSAGVIKSAERDYGGAGEPHWGSWGPPAITHGTTIEGSSITHRLRERAVQDPEARALRVDTA